ncbi:MAG TPA: TolC family protein [Saprospiraceae bacterium]|nr:TolC family protein [Saprospiraceae bacterium]
MKKPNPKSKKCLFVVNTGVSIITIYLNKAIFFLFIFMVNAGVSQSLDEYLITAAENNSNLKSKYLQFQAAMERIPQVGTLPDPQLGFSLFIMPMERYMGDQRGSISVMQMLPWFGTLEAAKNEMNYMAKAKYEEFNEAKSMLFYEVRANWYALQLLEKEISITKENIELLKTMEQVAIAKYISGGGSVGSMDMKSGSSPVNGNSGSGMSGMGGMEASSGNPSTSRLSNSIGNPSKNISSSGSMIDVLRVQIEINELANNLALLEDSKIPVIAQFNQLLNRRRDESIFLSDTILAATLPISLLEIPDSIKINNPILKMLEQEEAAYIAQGRMKEKMGLPMISVGLQYDIFRQRANSESRMNGHNMLMPMATVTIPIWRKKYTASVKESEFMRRSVVEQKHDIGNQLMVNYEEALKDFKDAERRAKLYQNQTSLANQVLNILIVQYTTEGSDFEELLRMQQQLLDYRLKYLDALIDGNISVAMMERLMGR